MTEAVSGPVKAAEPNKVDKTDPNPANQESQRSQYNIFRLINRLLRLLLLRPVGKAGDLGLAGVEVAVREYQGVSHAVGGPRDNAVEMLEPPVAPDLAKSEDIGMAGTELESLIAGFSAAGSDHGLRQLAQDPASWSRLIAALAGDDEAIDPEELEQVRKQVLAGDLSALFELGLGRTGQLARQGSRTSDRVEPLAGSQPELRDRTNDEI